MLERFTPAAREVVVRTQVTARSLGHERIGTEHVLVAALEDPAAPGVGGLVGLGVTADAVRALLPTRPGAQGFGQDDAAALRTLGIDLDEIRRQVEGAFGEGALESAVEGSGRRRILGRRDPGGGHIRFSAKAKRSLSEALRSAQARQDREIGVEHLLLGLLAVQDGVAVELLARLGVGVDAARAAVLAELDTAA
jgi:hypothetical protein